MTVDNSKVWHEEEGKKTAVAQGKKGKGSIFFLNDGKHYDPPYGGWKPGIYHIV